MNNLTSLSDKWQLIDRIAKNDGYNGIQLSNPFYGIPLDNNMPEYVKNFRLTYHLDYTADFSQDGTAEKYNCEMENCLHYAVENRIEDASLHPPIAWHKDHHLRDEFQTLYSRIIEMWLPKFESESLIRLKECSNPAK